MWFQEASGKFVLHTVQLLPQLVVRTLEHQKMFTLQDNGEFTYGIAVRGKKKIQRFKDNQEVLFRLWTI